MSHLASPLVDEKGRGPCLRLRSAAAWLAGGLIALTLSVTPTRAGPVESPADRLLAFRDHLPAVPLEPKPPRVLALQDDYDALRYELSLVLDVAERSSSGTCEVTLTPSPTVDLLPTVVLDLDHELQAVSEVLREGSVLNPTAYQHAERLLTITLDPPLLAGETTTLTVRFSSSRAGNLLFKELGGDDGTALWSHSQPNDGRGWWPSKDRPDDKAIVSVSVDAPSDLLVVSNGLQTSRVEQGPDRAVTSWASGYPVSTYLVSIAIARFETWEDTYTSLDGRVTMPVQHWAWPEFADNAREDWSITVEMMEFFAGIFYEYPFLEEKYGHAMMDRWGAMEHQTVTSYGAQLTTGDHRFDFVVAHELAHQWWGDQVGPVSWDSIWLNEGFASYSEALWTEHLGGIEVYHQKMDGFDRMNFPGGQEWEGTLHAPDQTLANIVYGKGAWVLHMLRWVLGQPSTAPDAEVLLPVLRSHGEAHVLGSADSEDFIQTASEIAEADLHWFFDQWLHREGRPHYEVGWSASPGPLGEKTVHLRVEQVQAGEPYAMPVLVRIEMPGAAPCGQEPCVLEELVFNEAQLSDYQFVLPEVPVSVTWDEPNWVLKSLELVDVDGDEDGWPHWLDGCPTVYNPEQEDSDGDGTQDACQPDFDYDGDGAFNENDCNVLDPGAWRAPSLPSLLHLTHLDGARVRLSWEHPDPDGQAPYVGDVSIGDVAELREGFRLDGSCALPGVVEPEWVDETPLEPGLVIWYRISPWNGCGPETPSPCR